jgi:uncharacterized protein
MAVDLSSTVILGGMALGLVFGAVAQRSNFCTMGAISDIVNMGHWGRMRMWMLAVAVAMLGTAALAMLGWVDTSKAVAMRPTLPWLSLIVGGLIFGAGMTLTGGCPSRNLVRLGSGSLRSLVVLVIVGVSGYMAIKGLFAQWRSSFLDPMAVTLASPDQGLGTMLSAAAGLPRGTGTMLAAALIGGPLAVFALKDARFRATRWQWLGGLLIGAVIVGGWYVSGHLGYGENPETLEDTFFATNSRTLESLSFIAPLAYGLELLMLWTDQSLHLSFGIGALMGMIVGAAAVAVATGRFRWEGFASLTDLRRHLIGAVMMGFGGVTALGCTVGQGLSGVSTMAVGSFIAVASIVAGCVTTLKYLDRQA